MSLVKSAPALELELTRSNYLCLFIVLSHGGAAMAVVLTAIDPLIRVILMGVILVSFYRSWNPTPKFPRLCWDGNGQWWLYDGKGSEYHADLLPGAYVHPWLVILRFRVKRTVHDLVLVPDNVGRTQLRRLRVRLKHDI